MGTLDLELDRIEDRITVLESALEQGVHGAGAPIQGTQFIIIDAINSARSDDATTVHKGSGDIKRTDNNDNDAIEWSLFLHAQQKSLDLNAFFGTWAIIPLLTVTVFEDDTTPAETATSIIVRPVLEEWDPDLLTWDNRPTAVGDNETQTATMPGGGGLQALGGDATMTQRAPILSVGRSDFLFDWGLHATQFRLTQAQIDAGTRIHGYRIRLVVNVSTDDVPEWEALGELNPSLLDSDNQPRHAALLY